MTEHETQPEKLDRKVFAISIICLAIVSMTMVLFPDGSRDGANTALTWLTDRLGWFYLLAGMAPIIMASWLAFGPYGECYWVPRESPQSIPLPVGSP